MSNTCTPESHQALKRLRAAWERATCNNRISPIIADEPELYDTAECRLCERPGIGMSTIYRPVVHIALDVRGFSVDQAADYADAVSRFIDIEGHTAIVTVHRAPDCVIVPQDVADGEEMLDRDNVLLEVVNALAAAEHEVDSECGPTRRLLAWEVAT